MDLHQNPNAPQTVDFQKNKEKVRDFIASKASEIGAIFIDEMKITVVVRHPTKPKASVVISNEEDPNMSIRIIEDLYGNK